MPPCSLLNIEDEVLAVGRLCTGAMGRMCHDTIVPANLGKVLVDKILMPDAKVIKANKFVETLEMLLLEGTCFIQRRTSEIISRVGGRPTFLVLSHHLMLDN